jgi:hypothetical protein
MLLHTLMLRRDITYVSTPLLLLLMRARTIVGAYRMTYVAYPHNCRCVPPTYVDALRTTNRATDALCTVCVAAYSTTVHVITHLMLLPYNLCHTVTQLMLLGHDCTTCVIRSISYDVMSLLVL